MPRRRLGTDAPTSHCTGSARHARLRPMWVERAGAHGADVSPPIMPLAVPAKAVAESALTALLGKEERVPVRPGVISSLAAAVLACCALTPVLATSPASAVT